MAEQMFGNEQILAWLTYYSSGIDVDLSKVKIIDITRKNRNLIPTVESHNTVLVLTDAGHPDIFYTMWDAGLGDCDIWYNDGSEPVGEIRHDKLRDMINRGINASAGMLVVNPQAKTTYKVGMANTSFTSGTIHYVGSEIRAVIMNKLHLDAQENICIVSGESIAVEAAMIATEGTVVAVERKAGDRSTMEENISSFGLENVTIVDDTSGMPEGFVPDVGFIVASSHLEDDLNAMMARNPKMRVVVYLLDLNSLSNMPRLFGSCSITHDDTVQVSVSRLNSKFEMETGPAPWLVSGHGE